GELLLWPNVAHAEDLDRLVAGDAERLRRVAARELQRQHAHADEVGAVDALEAARDHNLYSEEHGALRGPVARGAGAVLFAAEDDRRRAVGDVAHGRVIDRKLFLLVQSHSAFGPRKQQVLDAHVGEGAAHHDLVVAAPGAEGG